VTYFLKDCIYKIITSGKYPCLMGEKGERRGTTPTWLQPHSNIHICEKLGKRGGVEQVL
jgi:hypothetical protein